jgi:probable F420-dependent oxidoreductase
VHEFWGEEIPLSTDRINQGRERPHVDQVSLMKFGVILPNYGAGTTTEEMLAVTKAAERLNFDSVWTTDHILLPENESRHFGILYEALTTLAFLAGSTTKINLGISALVLPLRDPILVAKQIATLDCLSKGRMMLCVAAGWAEGEFGNLRQSFSNRGRRLDEGIQLLRTLWGVEEGDPIDFAGQYFQFVQAIFSPRPVQEGGPPIWVGGTSAAARTRAVTLGDGWHPSTLSLDQFRDAALGLRDQLPTSEWTLSARIHVSFDQANSSAQLQGTDEQVIETLGEFQSSGLQYPVLAFPGPSAEERLSALERFAEHVMPAFTASQ